MKLNLFAFLFFLSIVLASVSSAIDITFYYGQGCSHCAATAQTFGKLTNDYDLNLVEYEVYNNPDNLGLLFSEYGRFGFDPNNGGVPTTVIDDKTLIVGTLSEENWRQLFELCKQQKCPDGIFSDSVRSSEEVEPSNLTWVILIGAAIADSVNPCVLALMVLLLGTIMSSKGKERAFISGIIFTATIFVMYVLYGFGIIKVITNLEFTTFFYALMTIAALVFAFLEFNAYIHHTPELCAFRIPRFANPLAKLFTLHTTSFSGVALVAVFCSLFLVPCSSGPYLIILSMLAKSPTFEPISYLLAYNLLFVLPMLIVTGAVYLGKTTMERVDSA